MEHVVKKMNFFKRLFARFWHSVAFVPLLTVVSIMLCGAGGAHAAFVEFNSAGGLTPTDGLHFYIDDSTKIQVRRLNNTGQVYEPTAITPSVSLDNGIFIRANGRVYGPSNQVSNPSFTPPNGMYNTFSIAGPTPVNSATPDVGVQQTATSNFGITSGPQVSVLWKYTTPLDFLTAEVTVTIPSGFLISASNPVRYYHVFDTYLGGSDLGCGIRYTDSAGKLVVGTYPAVSGNCPSQSAIPTGVSVVESFRERSGLTFSNYCASNWDSFFFAGSTNCAVVQTAVMSNTIAATNKDTGIGIEYNFSATGTYTFSYDFVVGSPNVPPYDHLEIQHDGISTLCPDNITVLACTSSTVPCPAASRVNTGTLTGNLKLTPAAPAVTQTPNSFTLGASGSTAVIALQGSGAGAYTFSSNGLSSVPLNGTKCWNTATNSQSCAFAVTAVPCVSNYECLETGATYNNRTTTPAARNPLYTKLSGTNFKFDVVALQTGGVQSATYTAAGNVTVELFDDSASPQPACSAYASPVASQAITFAATDAGRKTVATNFNVPNAYSKLRCRVKDTNLTPNVYGCSSDDFAVRPSGLNITSSANADGTGTSASTASPIKTGANFTLTAASGVVGYNLAPKLDSTKVAAHSGAVQAGVVAGTFGAASTITGTATGAAFNYSEVGYFNFLTGGVYDDSLASVDSLTGDCTADFSNTLVSGKYGCKFGNTAATAYFGRFIPDHFAVTAAAPVAACRVHPPASGSYTPTDFTYFDQDGFITPFTITAQNSANASTQNYTGSFARLGLGAWSNYGFSVAILPAGSTLSAGSPVPSGAWINGSASVTAAHKVSRPTALVAPTNVVVRALPVDLDGVTLPAAAVVSSAGTSLRYGRLRLLNGVGPDTRDLKMTTEAQYWNGSNFTLNTDDSCTVIAASAWGFGNYVKRPASVVFNPVATTKTLAGGSSFVMIPKPGGGRVTFDASINLATTGAESAGASCLKNLALGSPTRPWAPTVSTLAPSPVRTSLSHLLGQWCDSSATNNPSARGSFGLYRGAESSIFQRENY
jgi:MSHA biogenesis protein MshQ